MSIIEAVLCSFTTYVKNMHKIFTTVLVWTVYCPASLEWQWRRVLLKIVKYKINLYTPLELTESIDHMCINPILRIGLTHK